jgi:hypothetical protein
MNSCQALFNQAKVKEMVPIYPKDGKLKAKHQDATSETRQLPIIIKPREALLTL